jgi:hypothetical protein
VQIGHRLHEAGIEFAEADVLLQLSPLPASITPKIPPEISPPFHDGEFQLSVIGAIAEEISACGLAFDKANLRHLTADG